jgi:hypothetical protein
MDHLAEDRGEFVTQLALQVWGEVAPDVGG